MRDSPPSWLSFITYSTNRYWQFTFKIQKCEKKDNETDGERINNEKKREKWINFMKQNEPTTTKQNKRKQNSWHTFDVYDFFGRMKATLLRVHVCNQKRYYFGWAMLVYNNNNN